MLSAWVSTVCEAWEGGTANFEQPLDRREVEVVDVLAETGPEHGCHAVSTVLVGRRRKTVP